MGIQVINPLGTGPRKLPLKFSHAEKRFIFISLSWVGLFGIQSCHKVEPDRPFIPNTGQIQILNGCGKSGIAEVFRDFLINLGFDVIEFGNASSWNYENTLVIARGASDVIAKDLVKVIGTNQLVHLQSESSLVEATVVIGKDYEELIRTWSQSKPQKH